MIDYIGAMFVPFSPQIVAHALEYAERHDDKNWEFKDATYTKLGYVLSGNQAERPEKPNPFL